jgi:DNA-directed RNA polymerase specialized sigma24 family protein
VNAVRKGKEQHVTQVSLDAQTDEGADLSNAIPDESAPMPWDRINSEEDPDPWRDWLDNVIPYLTDHEHRVLELRLTFDNTDCFREMAEILNVSKKNIDNTMQRIRTKIVKYTNNIPMQRYEARNLIKSDIPLHIILKRPAYKVKPRKRPGKDPVYIQKIQDILDSRCPISPAMRETLTYVAQGLTYKEIANLTGMRRDTQAKRTQKARLIYEKWKNRQKGFVLVSENSCAEVQNG